MPPLTGLRAAFGALLLVAPQTIVAPVAASDDRAPVIFARVLGARHLAQAAVAARHGSRAAAIGGVAVDAVHAATAFALAAADARHRRVALANAATASLLAAAGVHEARVCG
jgi:hypothetical protein